MSAPDEGDTTSAGEEAPSAAPGAMEARERPRPPEQRRRRLRELFSRVGPSVQQFYKDGCDLVDGTVVLETGAKVVAHCAREIDSSVRSVLRTVFLDSSGVDLQHDCGFKPEVGETHRREIERIVAALGLEPAIRADVTRSWVGVATGRGRGPRRKGWAARAHRRGLERVAPISDTDRADWRELEGVMNEILRPLEEQFSRLLPMFDALARRAAPTNRDLERLRALPNTYTTRRHFFERATPGWLPLLDGAGLFDQTEDAFAFDVVTQELLPQHWTAGEYLARVGVLPEHQDRFVRIVSRVVIPHERAALDLVKAARTLPAQWAIPVADRFAKWVAEQTRVVFIGKELAQLAAEVGRIPAGEGAATRLLAALLSLAPDPRLTQRTDE